MQGDIKCATTAHMTAESQVFQKRIGSTTYRVITHFSQTSTETIEDKLIRLMENEVQEIA